MSVKTLYDHKKRLVLENNTKFTQSKAAVKIHANLPPFKTFSIVLRSSWRRKLSTIRASV